MVTLPEQGDCGRCRKGKGIHKVLEPIDPPIKGIPELDIPDMVGVYIYLCDACYANHQSK